MARVTEGTRHEAEYRQLISMKENISAAASAASKVDAMIIKPKSYRKNIRVAANTTNLSTLESRMFVLLARDIAMLVLDARINRKLKAAFRIVQTIKSGRNIDPNIRMIIFGPRKAIAVAVTAAIPPLAI